MNFELALREPKATKGPLVPTRIEYIFCSIVSFSLRRKGRLGVAHKRRITMKRMLRGLHFPADFLGWKEDPNADSPETRVYGTAAGNDGRAT